MKEQPTGSNTERDSEETESNVRIIDAQNIAATEEVQAEVQQTEIKLT